MSPEGGPAADRRDGQTLALKLADGRTVTLHAFQTAGAGLAASRCGVVIEGRRMLTMGVGDTEVYTCDGLVAAGAVPAAGRVQRIGLIYEVSSSNASFRTAVVLREDGGWHVDPTFAGKFDDTAAGRTIAALRRALR